MKSLRLLAGLALALAAIATPAGADRVTPEYAKQNLDLIPPTDPPAPDAPKLVPAVAGVHPRLLFTAADIATLKQRIASDPVKATYDANKALYDRFKLQMPKNGGPPDIVLNDTAALSTSMERWGGLAYFYALDKDPKYKQDILDILNMMMAQPYWADTAELDSNMGAAVNMMMVALLYDSVYNDVDADFRAKMDQCILMHARRMYYLGFMQKCTGVVKYWQQDPQPNHRWYRIAGEMSSLLVLNGEPNINTDYLLREMKKNEADFVMHWYPPDGDCHEGAGYQQFGFASILHVALMCDRDLGATYLKDTGLKKAWAQQIYYSTPAGGEQMSFGDDMNTPGVFNKLDAAFFACMTLNHDKDAQAMFKRFYESKQVNPAYPTRAYSPPWDMLEFYDPTVGEGDYKAIPTNRLFADLGAASLRDSWDPAATAFTFKCCGYGGNKLDEYSVAYADKYGNPHYLNTAHDDPDANSFSLTIGSDFMFHPGLYSLHKITENQNCITVDGKGQINEGSDFTQPVDGVDMRTLAWLTGWKQGHNGRTIIEGEAGKSYIGMDYKELYAYQYPETVPDPAPPGQPPNPLKPRNPVTGHIKAPPPPVLSRFRRTAIWMPGEYVLLLDDIRGNGPHDLMWRGTVQKGKIIDAADGKCQSYAKDGAECDFQILADQDFDGALDYEFLDGRFGSFLAQQFQFSVKADAVRFACLFDPWKKKPEMTLKKNGDTVTLTVKSDSFNDVWTWKAAKDGHTPSNITGVRGSTPLISLTAADKPPQG